MNKKRGKRGNINKLLEIPKEISYDTPKLTITGFNEMTIENYKGILEYEDVFVRVNTPIGIININGFELSLRQMSDEAICIIGKIQNIELENITDEEGK